jgi:uncharacterized membrane protein
MDKNGNPASNPSTEADITELNSHVIEEIDPVPEGRRRISPARIAQDVLKRFIRRNAAPELETTAERWHELNDVVHKMLLTGLTISTVLIVAGLILSGISRQPVPTSTSEFRQVLQELKSGSPAGLLNMGILILIATPIIRVFGSLAEFIYRRDWRYAAITTLVLLVLAVSLAIGKG